MKKQIKEQKIKNAKEWIKSLSEEETGDFWMEIEDMELIKESLAIWLKHQEDYKPSIKIILDGVEYEVKNG